MKLNIRFALNKQGDGGKIIIEPENETNEAVAEFDSLMAKAKTEIREDSDFHYTADGKKIDGEYLVIVDAFAVYDFRKFKDSSYNNLIRDKIIKVLKYADASGQQAEFEKLMAEKVMPKAAEFNQNTK